MSGVSRGETEALTTTRSRRKLIKLGVVLAVLLLGLAGGVYFGVPMIGSQIAVSALEKTLDDGTTTRVNTVNLSWTGPQRFEGLRVRTPDGHEADLDGELEQTLLALLLHRGKGDLGNAVVRGSAALNADALAPAPVGPTDLPPSYSDPFEPIPLGPEFAVSLSVEEIDLKVTSTKGPDLTGKVSATFSTQAGGSSTGTALLELAQRLGPTAIARADLSLEGLISHEGDLNFSSLESESSMRFDDVPSWLAVYLPGLPEGLDPEKTLGPVLEGELELSGRLGGSTDATLTARLASAHAQAHVNTRLSGGRFSPTGDNDLRLDTAGLAEGWPAMAQWLADQQVTITQAPEIEIQLDAFDWINDDDLRGSTAQLTATIERTDVQMPARKLTGRDGPAAVGLEPTTLSLTFNGDALTLVSTLECSIDQTPAGVVDLDLKADGLLTDRGRPALTRIPGLTGTVTLTEVPSGLLQPTLSPDSPIDLVRDLGPTLTSSIVAHAEPGSPTRIAVDVRSQNLKLNGSLDLLGPIATVDPSVGVEMVINRLSPTLNGVLGDQPPVQFRDDQGATLSLTTLTVDLDALARGGFAEPNAIVMAGNFAVNPFAVDMNDKPPMQVTMTEGDVAMNSGVLDVTARTQEVRLGEIEQALRVTNFQTHTTWPTDAPPRTESTLTIQTVRTAAAGAWLGDQTPLGSALTRINKRMLFESTPLLENGVLTAPFSFIEEDLGLTGSVTIDQGSLGGEIVLDVTDPEIIGTAGQLAFGTAPELLGNYLTLKATLVPAQDPSTDPLEMRVSINADRVQTEQPVRVISGPEGLFVAGLAQLRAEITPEGFDLARGHDEQNPATVRLSQTTVFTVRLDELRAPAGSAVSLDATLSATPLTIERVGEPGREYSAFETRIQSVPDRPQDLRLTAKLEENGRPVVNADLMALSILGEGLAITTDTLAFTGTATLDNAQTSMLDLFAGSDTPSSVLGPTASASFDLDRFPGERGTLRGSITSPRATGTIDAVSEGGEITLTQPARFELSEITESFSYQFAPMLPVVGSLTKNPATDRAASISIDSLHLPVPFDLSRLDFRASIDPGSASLIAEQGLAQLLRGNPTIGNSFKPFLANLQDGVLRVSELTIPIGEFSVPARGSYDLVNRTEDVFVQIPAASLLAEGLGDNQSGLTQILSQFLNVGLHKDGSMDKANAWRVDVDNSSGTPQDSDDPGRNSIIDLLDRIGG